jgi:hypothetical protein
MFVSSMLDRRSESGMTCVSSPTVAVLLLLLLLL